MYRYPLNSGVPLAHSILNHSALTGRCDRGSGPAAAPVVPGLPASYAREPGSRFSSGSGTTLPGMGTSTVATSSAGGAAPLTFLSSSSGALRREGSRESVSDYAGIAGPQSSLVVQLCTA